MPLEISDGGAFQVRISQAEAQLARACEHFGLPSLFEDGQSWAVMGGAVRDSLLFPSAALDAWPDIDLVYTGERGPCVEALNRNPAVASVALNSFGGGKVRLMDGTDVDIWFFGSVLPLKEGTGRWQRVLDEIDFGLNAALFAHDDHKIILHERWREDVVTAQVELLAPPRPARGCQAVRSIALHTKMCAYFGDVLTFGPRAMEEIRLLAQPEGEVFLEEAKAYLDNKRRTGRWPETVGEVFEDWVGRG